MLIKCGSRLLDRDRYRNQNMSPFMGKIWYFYNLGIMLKESTVYLKWAADVAAHWDSSRYARWAKDHRAAHRNPAHCVALSSVARLVRIGV